MYDLSQREQQVLHHLCRGLNNKEIAELMFVSPNTVKVHVSTILKKLGVDNRTIAAFVAGSRALVENDMTTNQEQAGSAVDSKRTSHQERFFFY